MHQPPRSFFMSAGGWADRYDGGGLLDKACILIRRRLRGRETEADFWR